MKQLKYIGCLVMACIAIGCSDYLDINENPNQAVSSTPELVLTNALNVTALKLSHNELGAMWGGLWAPSGSVSGFDGERNYNITTTFRFVIWNSTYNNLTDYKYVENQALRTGKYTMAGIARVMKAFNYQIIVDAYGNAPYSQALKGTQVLLPAYDDAAVIYDSLIEDIDKAKVFLAEPTSSTNPTPDVADIIFGGDTKKWIRFANTLKLRILLRVSGVKNVSAQVAELAADPEGFLQAGEDVAADPGFLRSDTKMNPFYEWYGYTAGGARAGNHDFYAVSEFLIETLRGTNDPRLSRIAYPTTDDGVTYKGMPLGAGGLPFLYKVVSGIGPAVLPLDNQASTSDLYKRPMPIMVAAESFFLQAEAVQRGYFSGDAKALYQTGIEESFRINGVANAAVAAPAYYNQQLPSVNFDLAANKIEAIITQKWIAQANYAGFEAWTEFRRTGYPNVPRSVSASGTGHPVRLFYPNSEYSNNAENAKKQGEISVFTSRIFWDVN